MRCCVKGCKGEVYYVHIDAYLELDSLSISKQELMTYPMCDKHDSEFHKWLETHKAKTSRTLNKKIKIKKW